MKTTIENTENGAGADSSPLPGSAPLIQDKIKSGRVNIENEWQTVQDHLDDGNTRDAEYYLKLLVASAERLRRDIATILPRTIEYREGSPCCTMCGKHIGACDCEPNTGREPAAEKGGNAE